MRRPSHTAYAATGADPEVASGRSARTVGAELERQ
jgi:hypothetical protein